ncbi:chloramphenicol phosphotransferase-like protein [Colletotrichum karsti]|uniref:Chloramphenicol phosphotransferase-like protein n=1 Tax=Colletotrichum karsti TaxID=1095194 RepID=A0A9P6LHH9_9PEZI|nr:chloramphenicol phosphotransferase-like protein [Colletotrichum karsti]KAF9873196.1 chloramphenicol phosphotransferase-like protein [Colletotrichum karsti]
MTTPQNSNHAVISNATNPTPPSPPSTPGKIVVLNGFPGTGKLTILQRAKTLLPPATTLLVDNHLLIDPVAAVIPERSAEHHALRRAVRAPIFKKLAERARAGCVVLMTACLAEGDETDAAFLGEYVDMVRGSGVELFWVSVECEQTVLEERVKSAGRGEGRMKLTDVGVLREMLGRYRLIEAGRRGDGGMRVVVRTLDVSGSVEGSVRDLMSVIGFPQGVVGSG